MKNFLMLMDTAYDKGYDDAKNGITECPYNDEASAHQWQCGYNDYLRDKNSGKFSK